LNEYGIEEETGNDESAEKEMVFDGEDIEDILPIEVVY
jgi:hypothetical protein